MQFIRTDIPEVVIIEPRVFEDSRGFFMETYQAQKFAQAGIGFIFVQDNHSRSTQYTLRGLHYQIRHAQGKLVRVVAGEIFDVAVDIRRSSSTFGKSTGILLSVQNKRQLWIPPGFAHGFYVLSEWAEVLYKATDYYSPESERTIIWNDPSIGIQWPLDHGKPPILSTKDAAGVLFTQAELFE
ncbi:dTDP-4-dehydrorhamnose 3,5-epimerase [bacterium]|nr:dTDP-4-dehydrorhamnose 3,5-epimerase [bacterium]PIW20482.1 MAG: dTDP-4-dehydrorhamnose 3,5-epimerase [Anaerolineae bacterium CG17_big_fil_post_rev_8_21_14_2_50_57_27]PJH75444.1 MAG: dTDP-4-dehydrorhamnose 3,5-epimerase [Anaerolineae bacterium CG_4_9_14_0_8_um_filter_58_9]